jgi:hypothetical protein
MARSARRLVNAILPALASRRCDSGEGSAGVEACSWGACLVCSSLGNAAGRFVVFRFAASSRGGGMAVVGQEMVNPISRERWVWLHTAASTGGAFCEFVLHLGHGALVAAPHIHPFQQERFGSMSSAPSSTRVRPARSTPARETRAPVDRKCVNDLRSWGLAKRTTRLELATFGLGSPQKPCKWRSFAELERAESS